MFFVEMQEKQPYIITSIMTQNLLKAGLKEYLTKTQNAVHSRMKQLHSRSTFKPINLKELDDNQRKIILESHMLLKKNRDHKI